MRSTWKLVFVLVIAFCSLCRATDLQTNIQVQQVGFEGDVQSGIAYYAAAFHVPVVAECIYDASLRVTIPQGTTTAELALGNLLAGTPLTSEIVDGVIHIYDRSIVNNQKNFLSYRFAWFKVPATATQFRNTLGERLANEWDLDPHRDDVIGSMGDGIQSSFLDPGKCIPEELREVTARELLLKEAGPARFVTIFIYPPIEKKFGPAAWPFISTNWFWRSIDRSPVKVAISTRQ